MIESLPPTAPRLAASGGHVHEGISYALPAGYRPLLLDLHVPAGTQAVPVVVWIHGGAFLSGDRRHLPGTLPPGSVFDALVAAGVAVATIDYRLSGEALFPAQLDDVHAALAYLRRHATELRLDTGRIGVWGESAGGMLAALAGLTDGSVAAVAAWYPPTDLGAVDQEDPDTPEARLIGGAPGLLPREAALASPVSHVTPAAPPFLLVHGTADRHVPPRHSELLHERLLAAGVRSTYVPVAGAAHVFEDCDEVPELIAGAVAFFVRELSADGPAPAR